MDISHHLHVNLPLTETFIFAITIILVLTVFRYAVLNDSHEQPVSFKVPAPQECDPKWKGEILDNPSIKVFFPSIPLPVHSEANCGFSDLGAVLYSAIVLPMANYLAW